MDRNCPIRVPLPEVVCRPVCSLFCIPAVSLFILRHFSVTHIRSQARFPWYRSENRKKTAMKRRYASSKLLDRCFRTIGRLLPEPDQ